MKRLLSRLRPSKKVLALAVVSLAVIGTMGAVKAWYPNRPTFTTQNPAPYVTFDSITNNPDYGDERTFFDAKNATNTASGGYADSNSVTDGEELTLRIYVHNDAASNLNTVSNGKGGYVGVATGTSAKIELPTATSTALRANAYIDASNSNPGEVADTTDFTSSLPFNVTYEPGSAIEYTNAVPSGFKLSDNIVSRGAPIGYTGPNGVVPGCFQYTGVIIVKVKVHTASFSVSKSVAHIGDTSYSKSITANPGETVAYQLGFTNTGSQQLNNVVLRDKLPANETLVSNSSILYNANHPSGVNLQTDAVTSSNGVNIGDYTGKANGFLQLKATLPTADKLQCGTNTFVNTVEAFVNGQEQSDTATVTVNKTCTPTTTTPTYACTAFDADVTDTASRSIKVTAFTPSQTGGATFDYVDINWGDNSTHTMANANNVVGQPHSYAGDGMYNVTATAYFNVPGQSAPIAAPVANCSKTFTFSTPGTTTIVTTSTPTTPVAAAPTALVNTGPGQVIGLFAAVSVAGAFAYRLFLSRKLAR